MRHIFLLLTLLLAGCGLFDSEKPDAPLTRLVHDGTPYILSVLEATPDTVLHHPEVYVGRLYDPFDLKYDPYSESETIEPLKRIWNPILSSQVTNMAAVMRFRPKPDTEAEVFVTGPMGHSSEQRVRFTHEQSGVYGDLARKLSLKEGSTYRLEVTLADGSRYSAQTTLPGRSSWPLPDRIEIPTKLYRDVDGYLSERGQGEVSIYTIPENTVALIENWNRELQFDRYIFGLYPEEKFRFQSRGNWWRAPGNGQQALSSPVPDTRPVEWGVDFHVETRYDSLYEYKAVFFLNSDIYRWYNPVYLEYGSPVHDPMSDVQQQHYDAAMRRDTTYLPRLSNVHRVDEQGKPLPYAPGDAVGLFGGYSARFLRVTLVPLREGYDACRLWPSTPCKTGS